MIDSHCHLADRKFEADLPQVIERAKAAGVDRMVTIADSLEESERCIALAEQYPNIFCTVGVHPHNAKRWSTESSEELNTLARRTTKVRAIGEIGLDYHYDFSPREDQRRAFNDQLDLAKELKLPVVVHCREAVEDVWRIVQEQQPKKLVLHCCTEQWEDVARFVDRGYCLSFTGIATYPNAAEIRRTLEHCPMDHLMIETDAPYLPPEALRAKGGRSIRNEPAFITEIAKLVARLKGISFEEVDRITTKNTVDFFGLS